MQAVGGAGGGIVVVSFRFTVRTHLRCEIVTITSNSLKRYPQIRLCQCLTISRRDIEEINAAIKRGPDCLNTGCGIDLVKNAAERRGAKTENRHLESSIPELAVLHELTSKELKKPNFRSADFTDYADYQRL